MKYAILVALREFGENARTKGFWIGLLMFPLILSLSFKVPALLEKKATPTRYFVLVDESQDLGAAIDRALDEAYERQRTEALSVWMETEKEKPAAERSEFEPPRRILVRVPLPDAGPGGDPETDLDQLRERLRPYLVGDQKIQVEGRAEKLFAFVYLPAKLASERRGIEYWCSNLADSNLLERVRDALDEELRRREFQAAGVASDEVERIAKVKVEVAKKDPTKRAGEETVGLKDTIRQWAPAGFVYLLFVSIMTVAQMLLNNTTEEKSNRIVEVLLSSVTPWELMFGKLLGIAGIGFTMLAAWLLSGLGVLKMMQSGENEVVGYLLSVVLTPRLLLAFGVYFLLGYLLYASIFLAIGSMCNTIKEAQNFMGPVILVMIVPLLTMAFIPRDPNGTLAVVLSWIPLYTPFVMMNRAAADPPLFDLIGTFLLLVASVTVVVWLSGRIFRTGILRTGQPPRLLELLRWIRG